MGHSGHDFGFSQGKARQRRKKEKSLICAKKLDLNRGRKWYWWNICGSNGWVKRDKRRLKRKIPVSQEGGGLRWGSALACDRRSHRGGQTGNSQADTNNKSERGEVWRRENTELCNVTSTGRLITQDCASYLWPKDRWLGQIESERNQRKTKYIKR